VFFPCAVLDDWSKLPAIEQIYMEINNFSGSLPPSIGNATTLQHLSLGQSAYAGDPNAGQKGGFGGQIPKELGKLVNLIELDLGGNNFTGGIPPELVNMSSLQDLDVGQINLKGEIPPWLENMTSLRSLILRGNELTGTIPPSLCKLVNLTRIDLSSNTLTGPIPDSWTSLINLEDMTLTYNGLSGQIPTNLSRTLTSLQRLLLYNNNLSGPIPQDLGRYMPNLTHIDLTSNFFNGTLPDGMCEGGNLQILDFNNNSLGGAIPLSLASCPSMFRVRFDDNQFTSIPDGFGRNTLLSIFLAMRNQLTGQLPRGLGVNSQLADLDLSENMFTGNISILEFSQLAQNLSSLNLGNNNFTGEIPAAMGVCNLLFLVDLSYNSLTGAVPPALGNLSNLQELYLQGNKLTVLDPNIYSGFATTLSSLNLAENPWNVPIPTEIGSLRILQALNLSYGGYTGPIPSVLGQLGQLEVLDLSHNNLSGEVPVELGALMTSLTSVNVSFNGLTGSLPPEWVKFLTANPASFSGNPGLCLHYDANNECSDMGRPSIHGAGAKLKLSVRVIAGMVLGATALVLLVCVAFHFRRCRPVQEETAEEKEISEMNLTNEQWSLPFEEIMSATENLSDEHIIGRGAHGVVYKVKCVSDARPYIAVKKIVFTDTKTAVPHKTFWAEVKSAGKARHRNLVRLLGFIKRDEVGLLLYEYVPKGNLHSALHSTNGGSDLHLTWEARLRIAKGVACGLAYLHHDYDAPIVHRDIKSSNVLLDDELEAHISDFGLAKVLGMQQESKRWLSSQIVLGTYGYIAPGKHSCLCEMHLKFIICRCFHMSVILAHPVAHCTGIETLYFGSVFFDVQRPDLA
jgi:Leucine-rich repeat (LRR) protein